METKYWTIGNPGRGGLEINRLPTSSLVIKIKRQVNIKFAPIRLISRLLTRYLPSMKRTKNQGRKKRPPTFQRLPRFSAEPTRDTIKPNFTREIDVGKAEVCKPPLREQVLKPSEYSIPLR